MMLVKVKLSQQEKALQKLVKTKKKKKEKKKSKKRNQINDQMDCNFYIYQN